MMGQPEGAHLWRRVAATLIAFVGAATPTGDDAFLTPFSAGGGDNDEERAGDATRQSIDTDRRGSTGGGGGNPSPGDLTPFRDGDVASRDSVAATAGMEGMAEVVWRKEKSANSVVEIREIDIPVKIWK